MERRTALAVAAAGAMLTAVAVVAGASGLLRSPETEAAASDPASADVPAPASTSLEPVVVTETRDVYDTVAVDATTDADGEAAGASEGPAPTSGPSSPQRRASSTTTPPAPPPTHPVSPTTTTTTPTPTPTTTTTRPPGVPADWPADRPIPPMPANCRHPQLEDNGVWNCDH